MNAPTGIGSAPQRMLPTRRKKIEAALRSRKMTCKELAAEVFLSERAIEKNVNEMLALGQIHIAGWTRTAGAFARVLAWGSGTNAPRPKRFTVHERQARFRIKESAEDKDFRLARERGRRIKPKRDPLMAALFGDK